MGIENSNLLQKINASSHANPFWITGPCVIEDRDMLAKIAETVKKIAEKHSIPVVFKASFDKANRTSHESFRGPGIEQGLKDLAWIRNNFELPILTDVHETSQVRMVAEVVDIVQIPAFLCRQTDLIEAVCKTGKAVNLKKGQFVAPSNVGQLVSKLKNFGAKDFWITERGVTFGYQRLVVDFAAFPEMISKGAKIILDVTHSVQLPGGEGNRTGGIREAIPYLTRAGAAVGVSGFFAETHPDPSKAKSDGPNAWPLHDLESLMVQAKMIAEVAHGK